MSHSLLLARVGGLALFVLAFFTLAQGFKSKLDKYEASHFDKLERSLSFKLTQLLDNNAELAAKILSYLDTLPSSDASRAIARKLLKDDPHQGAWLDAVGKRGPLYELARLEYNFIKPVVESMLADGLYSSQGTWPEDVCNCRVYMFRTSSLKCCESCCERCKIPHECYKQRACKPGPSSTNGTQTSATATRRSPVAERLINSSARLRKDSLGQFEETKGALQLEYKWTRSNHTRLGHNLLLSGQVLRLTYAQDSKRRRLIWQLLQQIPIHVDRTNYKLLVEILASLGEPVRAVRSSSPIDEQIIHFSSSVSAKKIIRILENNTHQRPSDDDLLQSIDFRPILNNEGLLMVAGHLIRRIHRIRAGCSACSSRNVCHMDNVCPKSCPAKATACSKCPSQCPDYPKDVGCSEPATGSENPTNKTVEIENPGTLNKVSKEVSKTSEMGAKMGADKQKFGVVMEQFAISRQKRQGDGRKKGPKRKDKQPTGYTSRFSSTCGRAPVNKFTSKAAQISSYIVNGERQRYGEWPSYVSLHFIWDWGMRSVCGGTLISDRHVLTAAHCLHHPEDAETRVQISNIEVILGEDEVFRRDRHEKRLTVASACIARKFNSQKLQMVTEQDYDDDDDDDDDEGIDDVTGTELLDEFRSENGSNQTHSSVKEEEKLDEIKGQDEENASEKLADIRQDASANGTKSEDPAKEERLQVDIAGAEFDYAVIELSERVKFTDFHQPSCLPSKSIEASLNRADSKCYLVGAGAVGTHHGNLKSATSVQKMRMRKVSCRAYGFGREDESRFCFTKAGSVGDSCSGDSGGPILCLDPKTRRWTVVALVSYGSADCDGKTPLGWTGVYTRVTNLLPLIKRECGV